MRSEIEVLIKGFTSLSYGMRNEMSCRAQVSFQARSMSQLFTGKESKIPLHDTHERAAKDALKSDYCESPSRCASRGLCNHWC